MRYEVIKVETKKEAMAAAPWAGLILRTAGGFACFDVIATYEAWAARRDLANEIKNLPFEKIPAILQAVRVSMRKDYEITREQELVNEIDYLQRAADEQIAGNAERTKDWKRRLSDNTMKRNILARELCEIRRSNVKKVAVENVK